MNEENLTLLALDDYRSLIKQIRQMHAEGETFEEMDLQTKLSQQINEDAANKIIPERIVELKDDSNTTVDDMEHYINQIEDAYEQVTKSLDWNIDDFKDSGENKDSKDVLQGIKDLMTKYMDTYSKDEGMLSAVDEFSAIGDAIKHALEEKTISTTTALLLTEPLKHMKDHMFDSERQEKEAELFYDIINRQLDREDEKQGPEQDKEYAVNSTGSVLGNALRFLAESAEKIHNKFEKDANNVADKYDKEQAQKQAENSVKQPRSQEMPHKPDLEKKQQAKDVASNKNQDEMLREDKVLNEKSDQETPKTKKEALSELRVLDANIRKTLETFNNPSDEDKEKLKQQFVEFYTVLSNPNLKDLADEYYNRVVQNAAKGGLEDYNISELIDKEAAKKEEKKQEAKDVSQKPEEVMKKEDKIQETKEPEKIETKEQALQRLKDTLNAYNDTLHNGGNRLKAWHDYNDALHNPVLKDFTEKYFAEGNKMEADGASLDDQFQKLQEMVNNELKQRQEPGKAEQNIRVQETPHAADLSKKQEAKDVSPKMKREENTNDQKPQTKVEALQKLKEELAKYDSVLWGWGYPNGSYEERMKYGEDTFNSYWDTFMNPLLHDFVLDYYKNTKIQSNPGRGLNHHILNEMIKQELAKETGQKIKPGPQDAKIKALVDILGMVNHDFEDDLGYYKIKSAVQKMAEDKVISDNVVQDLQKIFDSKNYGTHGFQKVHDLEGVLMKHLYELESENEKQRQQGKGNTIETQQKEKNDIKQTQVKTEDLIRAAGLQEKSDKKETTIPQNISHESELSNKMQNKDVAQKPEDVMKKEDKVQETKEPETAETEEQSRKEADLQAKKQEVLKRIESSILVYDNLFSSDFGEATYELDKLAKYISQSVKDGNISHRDGALYRKMIGEVYGKTDWKQSSDAVERMLKLNDEQKERLENPVMKDKHEKSEQNVTEEKKQGLGNPEIKKESEQKIFEVPKEKEEKKQEAKDVSKKPEDLMQREELSKKPEKTNAEKAEVYNQGTTKVQKMDKKREEKGRTLDPVALAAYRRNVLLNRGGNV